MTREIKFRAWDKEAKSYVGDTQLGFTLYEIALSPFEHADKLKDLDFEQYTGLKDKNGKEIYEGDIVKIYKGRKLDSVLLVQFDELNGEYMWCKNEDIDSAVYGGFPYWAKYSVIGNIHENPELLGGKE